MLRAGLALAAVFVLLAGCAGPADPDSLAAAVGAADTGDGTSNVTMRPPSPEDWKTLEFSHAAPAGGWVILQHNFTPPRDIAFDYWMNITFKGPSASGPAAWFLQRPTPTRPDGNATRVALSSSIEVASGADAEPLKLTGHVNAPSRNGNYSGILVVFAANAPYELDLLIKIGKGGSPYVSPTHQATGDGAEFFTTSRRSPDVQGPVGTVTMDAEFAEPGWTHLETKVQRLTNTGVRRWDIKFPSGPSTGFGFGLVLFPVGGGSEWDRIADGAGAFHAAFDYAESDLSFQLLLMHAPLPPGAFPTWVRA